MTKYAEIFGRPGEGLHRHVCGVAVWDVVLTVIAAILLSHATGVHAGWAILGLFMVGEGLHFIFGVETAFVKWFKAE